jgi:hypothetical protein
MLSVYQAPSFFRFYRTFGYHPMSRPDLTSTPPAEPELLPELMAGVRPGDAARSPTTREETEEVDPELLALPDPPRAERTATLFILGFTAIAALAMVFMLARDAAYALAPSTATDVGDLRTSPPTSFGENGFVRAHGMLAAVGAIRYERPFASDTYRVAPVAGRPDVWVEMRIPMGQETARFVPPSAFSGRLVRFDAAGPRHRGLRDAIAAASGAAVPPGAWLVVDAETPSDARWAVALVFLFLGFAGWNFLAIQRLVRKVA